MIEYLLFKKSITILYFSFLMAFLFSCNTNPPPDRDKDGVEDSKDSCPDVAGVPPNGCPEKQIANIHFYIDNSASMSGYFNNNTEFDAIISDLISQISRIKPTDIYFIGDTIIKYPGIVKNFSDDIAQTPPAHQTSSQLNKMIDSVAAHTDSNDISLVVSDYILSFPDAAIKLNPEINRQKASSSLKSDISNAFYDLQTKKIATSVYAFKSKFYGTYYDYKNDKIPLTGDEERPFYLWVIGNKELLPKFDSALNDISTFDNARKEELHFGFTEEPVTSYDVSSQVEKKGDWMWTKSESVLEDINTKNSNQQFCVALNLATLPPYAKDISYLKNNLKIDSIGCSASFEMKDKNQIDRSKLYTPEQEIVEKNTHFIIFNVNSMSLPTASIHVTLPLQYDEWYKEWSCMDDKTRDSLKDKTFALEYLIDGVKEAYETKNKNYIDFTIKLKQ